MSTLKQTESILGRQLLVIGCSRGSLKVHYCFRRFHTDVAFLDRTRQR